MDKFSLPFSSEVNLKEHIASYPELYEDLAVNILEERLEMDCIVNYGSDYCECNGTFCECNSDFFGDGDCVIHGT